MSVIRQANLLGQQRIDVGHVRGIESSIAGDFDVLAGMVMAGGTPLVVSGFTVTNGTSGSPATSLQLVTAGATILHPQASENGTIFNVPTTRAPETLNAANTRVQGSFTASTANYIGVDLRRSADATTADLVQFINADTNAETPKTVPLARTLDYVIVISTQDFSSTPGIAPVAIVTTDAFNNVASVTYNAVNYPNIVDARSLAFRLGSGGTVPNYQNAYSWPGGRTEVGNNTDFGGGDRAITSLKSWMDAIMSRIWEIGGGQTWYGATADRNVIMTRTGSTFTNGEWFSWDGTTLLWQGLTFAFDNGPAKTNIVVNQTSASPGLTDLADGDCVYVDVNRAVDGASLQPVKAPRATLGSPVVPGSRYIIAWRVGSNVYTRDSSFPVGATFFVATTTALGIVKLHQASLSPSTPVVLSDGDLGTANGVLSLNANKQASLTSTTGDAGTFTSGGGNGNGITAAGNGTGSGVTGSGGGASGVGVAGFGNGTGAGVTGHGSVSGAGPGGIFIGGSSGTSTGVSGTGGSAGGTGVIGTGGGSAGIGVQGQGVGTSVGVYGVAGSGAGGGSGTTSAAGIYGLGGSSVGGSPGVIGQATGAYYGVQGIASSTAGSVGVYGITSGGSSFSGSAGVVGDGGGGLTTVSGSVGVLAKGGQYAIQALGASPSVNGTWYIDALGLPTAHLVSWQENWSTPPSPTFGNWTKYAGSGGGNAALTGPGTLTPTYDLNVVDVNCTTAAIASGTAGQWCIVARNQYTTTVRAKQVIVAEFDVMSPFSGGYNANFNYVVGLTINSGSSWAAANSSLAGIRFRWTGSGNWMAETANGSSFGSIDTGVPPTSATYQRMRIEYYGSSVGNTIKFYIYGNNGGNPVATATTSSGPPVGTSLLPYFGIGSTVASGSTQSDFACGFVAFASTIS